MLRLGITDITQTSAFPPNWWMGRLIARCGDLQALLRAYIVLPSIPAFVKLSNAIG